MTELKEILLQEQERLENILRRTEEGLRNPPQGTLRISFSGKWVQYYHCIPGERENGDYIPQTNKELIQKLAQKTYDEKILKLAEKRLLQIRRITKDYVINMSVRYRREGLGLFTRILPFYREEQGRKYTGNMMGGWMIRYMHRMRSEKYRHMKKMIFIPENG